MWDFITGALLTPLDTFRSAADKKIWRQGFLLVLVVGLINGLARAVTADSLAQIFKQYYSQTGAEMFKVMLTLIKNPAFCIVSELLSAMLLWLIIGLLCYGLGRLFKGEGSLGGVWGALALASTPYLICTPLQAVLSQLGSIGAGIGALVSYACFFWVVMLAILSVRSSMKLNSSTAAGCILLSGIGYILVMFMIIFVLVLLATVASAL